MHWIALQPQPEATPAPPPGDAPAGMPVRGEAESSEALASDTLLSDALTALGWWALQFTPKVARVGDVLVLEVSASERLLGGRQHMLRHMFEEKRPVAGVVYARGATSLIAMARLSFNVLHSTQGAHTPVDHLLLSTLAAARPHVPTLERMGCTHWGQLRALPRGGVARRFGAPLLDALDRAYGVLPEIYPWLVVPEVFEARLELSAQVETAPALLFGARRLLNQLQVWLQLRHCGVLAVVLMWTMDARRNTATQGELVVRTAEPTGDMSHLQRLLGEHLARVTLPAPVQYLSLRTLETQALNGQSASLLPDEQPIGDSLHQMLERLSARLGPHKVLQMHARADHRPEHMQAWLPVGVTSKSVANYPYGSPARGLKSFKNQDVYPTWLLAEPLKLVVHHNSPQYQGPLTLLAGPQRLEAGWWDAGQGDGGAKTCALRDYFLARSERLGLLWIYRERLMRPGGAGRLSDADPQAAWYLHGLFA